MDKHLIGIVTWHESPNPGTVFQAYALQQFINRIPSFEAELINYKYAFQKREKQDFLRTILLPWIKLRKNMIKSFSKNIVKYPPKKCLKYEELYLVSERYD